MLDIISDIIYPSKKKVVEETINGIKTKTTYRKVRL